VRIAWPELKPVASTAQFFRAAETLYCNAMDDTADMYSPSYGVGDLQQLGVALDDLSEVRIALTALLFGGAQALLAVEALRLGIGGQVPGRPRPEYWPRSRTTWNTELIPRVDVNAAGQTVRRVFAEARRVLSFAQEPLSLGVIGQFPRYLRIAWADVKSLLTTDEFAASVNDMISEAERLATNLPRQIAVTPECLMKAGLTERELHRVREILEASEDRLANELMLTALLRYPLGSLRGGF
jgi:hypothetical protein